jgi:hypothetical protein
MKARPRLLLGLGVTAALLLLAIAAGARPGGGSHYRSPSRSSYRSSGGSSNRSSGTSYRSSSSSSSSYRPSSTTVVVGSTSYGSSYSSSSSRKPTNWAGILIGLVIGVSVIALLVWLVARQKPSRATIAVDAGAQARGIMELRARDSGFSPEQFSERTKQTMAKVNEAWIGGTMVPARRLISDGVFVRFQTQLGLLKADGLRNTMANWRVVSADILAAECDDLWDTVHVKVVGEARDCDVPQDLTKEQALAKTSRAPLEQYHEVWSFLRRRGKTTKGAPALEGRCPGCGADMPLSDSVRCEYCNELVNSGEHDWVLAEITQPEEWSVWVAEEEVEGMDALRQRDPTVSRQELEDRASVIFWKWIEARHTGKVDALARFCLQKPEGPDAMAALSLTPAKLTKVAAGSSEVVSMRPGALEGRDQVLIEIKWSASVNGAEPEGDIHLFLLERAADAQSKRGLASLDCPVCAGPLPESDAMFCAYCGEALSGGKHEWALARVQHG